MLGEQPFMGFKPLEGRESSKAFEYGCKGSSKNVLASQTSTICPQYMTAILSASFSANGNHELL